MKRATLDKFELDEVDKGIINALLENGRESLTQIAYYTGVSRPTVRQRIEEMTDVGIIEGFIVLINRDLIKE